MINADCSHIRRTICVKKHLVERQGCLSAVEVKAGENTRARSLSGLKGMRSVDRLLRISTKPFGDAGQILSVPLYATFCL